MVHTSKPWRANTFMVEYSPRPGTARSELGRAEFDEPCTSNRTGSGGSPALGSPMRLRQRLSATSPFLAQYSLLQIAPDAAACGAAPLVPAAGSAASARLDSTAAPIPRPLP